MKTTSILDSNILILPKGNLFSVHKQSCCFLLCILRSVWFVFCSTETLSESKYMNYFYLCKVTLQSAWPTVQKAEKKCFLFHIWSLGWVSFVCLSAVFWNSVYAESYGSGQQTEETSNNSHHREVQKNLTDENVYQTAWRKYVGNGECFFPSSFSMSDKQNDSKICDLGGLFSWGLDMCKEQKWPKIRVKM